MLKTLGQVKVFNESNSLLIIAFHFYRLIVFRNIIAKPYISKNLYDLLALLRSIAYCRVFRFYNSGRNGVLLPIIKKNQAFFN
jgi:hypothetical protein